MVQTEGRTIVPSESTIETNEEDEVVTHGLGVQLNWPEHQRMTWVTGIEVYKDNIDSERVGRDLTTGAETRLPGRFPDGAEFLSAALYAQAAVRTGPRLDLIVGGRYSHFRSKAFIEPLDQQHRASFDDLTGSAHFLLRMTPHHHLGGGIAQGFRAPGLDDTTIFGQFNAGVEVPNPDLEPETLVNYELTYKARLPNFWASATLFESRLRDLIVRAPAAFMGSPTFQGEDVYQRQNLDRATINGGELELRTSFRKRLMVGFSLAKVWGASDSTGEPLRRIPPLFGRITLRSSLPWRTAWVELVTDFADRQDRLSPGDIRDSRIPEGGTPGYLVVSLGFGTAVREAWQINVVIYNIGDIDYRTHGSGINGPGRSLRVFLRRGFGGTRHHY